MEQRVHEQRHAVLAREVDRDARRVADHVVRVNEVGLESDQSFAKKRDHDGIRQRLLRSKPRDGHVVHDVVGGVEPLAAVAVHAQVARDHVTVEPVPAQPLDELLDVEFLTADGRRVLEEHVDDARFSCGHDGGA